MSKIYKWKDHQLPKSYKIYKTKKEKLVKELERVKDRREQDEAEMQSVKRKPLNHHKMTIVTLILTLMTSKTLYNLVIQSQNPFCQEASEFPLQR